MPASPLPFYCTYRCETCLASALLCTGRLGSPPSFAGRTSLSRRGGRRASSASAAAAPSSPRSRRTSPKASTGRRRCRTSRTRRRRRHRLPPAPSTSTLAWAARHRKTRGARVVRCDVTLTGRGTFRSLFLRFGRDVSCRHIVTRVCLYHYSGTLTRQNETQTTRPDHTRHTYGYVTVTRESPQSDLRHQPNDARTPSPPPLNPATVVIS